MTEKANLWHLEIFGQGVSIWTYPTASRMHQISGELEEERERERKKTRNKQTKFLFCELAICFKMRWEAAQKR